MVTDVWTLGKYYTLLPLAINLVFGETAYLTLPQAIIFP